jgi:hypothetical protein
MLHVLPLQLALFVQPNIYWAGPSGHAVLGVGIGRLACCDLGFESHRGMDVCLLCVLCVDR